MTQRAKKLAATIGITALAVVGLDAATYAGTGDSLVVGRLNTANRTTHLTSTGGGPALSLHAKGERAALAVDSKAKIARLNADLVDGKDATALQHNVRVLTATAGTAPSGAMSLTLPAMARGRYQVGYEVFMMGASGTVSNPTTASCNLIEQVTDKVAAYTSTISVGFAAGLSGNGVVTVAGRPWRLTCSTFQHGVGGDNWSIPSFAPIRVTLTRIDRTSSGKLTPAG